MNYRKKFMRYYRVMKNNRRWNMTVLDGLQAQAAEVRVPQEESAKELCLPTLMPSIMNE